MVYIYWSWWYINILILVVYKINILIIINIFAMDIYISTNLCSSPVFWHCRITQNLKAPLSLKLYSTKFFSPAAGFPPISLYFFLPSALSQFSSVFATGYWVLTRHYSSSVCPNCTIASPKPHELQNLFLLLQPLVLFSSTTPPSAQYTGPHKVIDTL